MTSFLKTILYLNYCCVTDRGASIFFFFTYFMLWNILHNSFSFIKINNKIKYFNSAMFIIPIMSQKNSSIYIMSINSIKLIRNKKFPSERRRP